MTTVSRFIMTLCLPAFLITCGKSDSSPKSSSKKKGLVETAFQKAAGETMIPDRFLMAIGFHESNLSSQTASVPYFQVAGSTQQHSLGFNMTETAFGLSREEIGVTKDKDGDILETQIASYAKWLSERLSELKGFNLKENPSTMDQRFEWLWAIGSVHIPDDRNIRAIWVKSIMAVLNEGRVWQDARNGEILELKPESNQYDENKLVAASQAMLTFEDDISDINAARRLDLVTDNGSTLENNPRRIEVVHCPLSLASCLKMQDSNADTNVKIGAHYIIPQDSTIISRPIQILDHERRVQMTSSDGTIKDVKDAVVIMLVGNSGRYVDGERVNADPTWFTAWQLRKLGATIKGVCSYLASRHSNIDEKKCSSTEDKNGVHFYTQGTRPTYRWGDIPDYDKSIFWAYLKASDANVQGEVLLNLPGNKKQFTAGKEIELKSQFSSGTRWLRLQRAVRCDDKQLVWDTLRTEPIVNKKNFNMKITVWDAGPNHNGRQFMRVLVYDNKNQLLGWSINDFYLEKFDEKFSPPSEACFFKDLQ